MEGFPESELTGHVGTGYARFVNRFRPVEYEAAAYGLAVFQGDIVLGSVQDLERDAEHFNWLLRRGVPLDQMSTDIDDLLWPGAVVPYVVNETVARQERVRDAISEIERTTVVRLVPRTDEDDFIEFVSGSGCASYVGRQGGRQSIWLSAGCSTGNVIHEICHALRLGHEHSRFDRDAYMRIRFDRIRPGRERNFRVLSREMSETWWRINPRSIMMYPDTAFSVDGQPTIEPTVDWPGFDHMGQREGLHKGDIRAINGLYKHLARER